ncbi:hypothetical protein DFR55_1179 [Herbinix hemicellulosilytica]|uniref:Uncharacterized protein n=1 Tax=Herbinix hemicellulosilytica TaxID=1564487 RepID=A0A0H5SKT1_HERHM|nr:hypothetical protein DFR55_1179 [Herbinix hemicellulosilytica]CRZ35725.1 hypothetical protein HHT355_2542 [Herbinix hemicellulosilytica]
MIFNININNNMNNRNFKSTEYVFYCVEIPHGND